MVTFETIIQKFDEKGEKTGWAYLEIPLEIANQINPNIRTSYRVKGKLDNIEIKQVALLPMGDGGFIIPFNATYRKKLGKKEGSKIELSLELDNSEFVFSEELMSCLADEPAALAFFESLPKSHQKYFSNWVDSAKTIETRTKRMTQTVVGCSMGLGYGEMIQYFKNHEI